METGREHLPATSGAAFTAGSDISADKTSSLKVEKVLNDIILMGVNTGMLSEEDLVWLHGYHPTTRFWLKAQWLNKFDIEGAEHD